MAGQSAKKARKAESSAISKYQRVLLGSNAVYFLLRMCLFFSTFRFWVIMRWIFSTVVQMVTYTFVVDAEAANSAGGKNLQNRGEHFFDVFALVSIVQVAAALEYVIFRAERSWYLTLIVPGIGLYYVGSFGYNFFFPAPKKGAGDDDGQPLDASAEKKRRKMERKSRVKYQR
uniref:Transmembrane protein 208 n=1 Tax=Octactis speculum TaxID=3111310 RepID=A0A7S2CGI7_9STRA|mmetsp:Transcript_35677/g.48182  ORF Transcript_35677/g.48182 Transcript_35677/m.48182 type:complete len:173 (+) Transcript_35677:21-539(+)